MRVAVTGSAGFIGRAVVDQLEDNGVEVIRVDRSNGDCDIRSAADCDRLIGAADGVIHLAGMLGTSELFDTVHDAIDVNVHGTANVLNAVRHVEGFYVGITMPDCWPSLYQATKLAGVRMASAYHHAYGVRVTHIRAFNAYGIGQAHGHGHPQKIIPTFAYQATRGLAIPIWGDGDQTVDLVHVDHIAACLVDPVLNLRSPAYGQDQTWDAGSGVEHSVLDVAERVIDLAMDGSVEHLPMRAGELPHTKLCATAPGPLGFDASIDSVLGATRLAETVDAYAP